MLCECCQNTSEGVRAPEVTLELLDLSAKGHKWPAVQSLLNLTEGQSVTFVLRTPPDEVWTVILGQDDENKGKLSREHSPSLGHHKWRVDDPFLTNELLSSRHPCYMSVTSLPILSFLLNFLAYTDCNSVLV